MYKEFAMGDLKRRAIHKSKLHLFEFISSIMILADYYRIISEALDKEQARKFFKFSFKVSFNEEAPKEFLELVENMDKKLIEAWFKTKAYKNSISAFVSSLIVPISAKIWKHLPELLEILKKSSKKDKDEDKAYT